MSRMSRYLEGEQFPLTKNNEVSYYGMGEDHFSPTVKTSDAPLPAGAVSRKSMRFYKKDLDFS